LTEGRPAVLLCYETIGKYCHRHLVSDWLRRHGIECREYLPVMVEQKPKGKQGSLDF
jgi:uncharacterized protein (DUF488 family)